MTENISLELTIQKARQIIEEGSFLDDFLSGVDADLHAAIRNAVEPAIKQISFSEREYPSWVDKLNDDCWYHWLRLENCLRVQRGWKDSIVASVASESLKILRKLPDPKHNTFRGQGLVVGYVQSGKTANYTALAARAVDAGYRMVIVLSGIHDSLRNQTQARLERELTGHQDGGVGYGEHGKRWIRLTTPDRDFTGLEDQGILQSTAPMLIVAKKLVPILEKIDTWFRLAGGLVRDIPILLIDDEADLASINTRGNRNPDLAVSDEEEPRDEDSSPTRTNALIRHILGGLPKVCYVAYTATPFANILINPDSVDRIVGGDLFPHDFILQLPRPEDYTGTEELFGVSAQNRKVIQLVRDEDVRSLRGAHRRSTAGVQLQEAVLPQSLADAIQDFMIAGSIRKLRGLGDKPHTMLVHVSQRISDQQRIADLIEGHLEALRAETRFNIPAFRKRIADSWGRNQSGIDSPPEFEEFIEEIQDIVQRIEVLVLNSSTGAELDYDSNPSRHIIAVGGNRLSRGLTLEGLTVSYFLRTSTMCDTLMQMGRWYGYRNLYEDLIRIWTTEGIARWFAELSLVEQSLRDSIIALNRSGQRPDQMALRLRAHSELLLTSKAKSRQAEERFESWSAEHPQTVLLPLCEPSQLVHNREWTEHFISNLVLREVKHGGLLGRDISHEAAIKYINGYKFHTDIRAFDGPGIAAWIRSRAEEGELVDWSVFVASSGVANTFAPLAQHKIGLTKRKRICANGIGILIDPRHEGVDLPNGPESFRRSRTTYDTEAMRKARPASQGLLLIYPLDASYLGIHEIDTVIAIALSLPNTSDGGQTWIANRSLLGGGNV